MTGGAGEPDLGARAAWLRREALALLDGAGLRGVLGAALGQVATVGSVDLDLMTWPDIDLYTRLERDEGARMLAVLPDVSACLEAHGYALIQVSFHDRHLRPDPTLPHGLYIGLRILPPEGEPTWKVDLWGWDGPTFAEQLGRHAELAGALAGVDRDLVLRIKDAAARRPSYRHTVSSVDVYEFVLAGEGSTVAEFDAFLARRDGPV